MHTGSGYVECLDWHLSQFINILGKDDLVEVGGRLQVSHMFAGWGRAVLPHRQRFCNPAHPPSDSGGHQPLLEGEGLLARQLSAVLCSLSFPLPWCNHASRPLGY